MSGRRATLGQTHPVRGEGWRSAAGDLLLGSGCQGCGSPGWGICARCQSWLIRCLPSWTVPEPSPDRFPPTVASAPYEAPLRQLINAHKERQALSLTSLLGDRLALSVQLLLRLSAHDPAEFVTLVPVPSARAAVRQRGFDSTGALAASAARRLAPRYRIRTRRVLAQTRRVLDQAGLDAVGRQENLAGAYRLRGGPLSGPIIVVDDVVTSGASLAEAVRCLEGAGADVLGAATVAATQRTHPVGTA